MKSVRWFSLLIALVAVAPMLTGCSETGTNSTAPATTSTAPTPASSNAVPGSSPAAAPNAKPSYTGAVDKKDCEIVGGWVKSNTDATANVRVELYIDDKLIETQPATTLRKDLTSWGTGLHGFTFKIPASYKDGKPHQTKVKVAGANHEVPFIQNASGIQCPAA